MAAGTTRCAGAWAARSSGTARALTGETGATRCAGVGGARTAGGTGAGAEAAGTTRTTVTAGTLTRAAGATLSVRVRAERRDRLRPAGSPATGASPGTRTSHRRRTTAGDPTAAGSGTAGRGRRAPAGAGPRACTTSPCWSGSSTGTPRRTAHRPHGAYGTAGRAPAPWHRAWAAGRPADPCSGHRTDHRVQGRRGRDRGRREAGSRSRRRAGAGEEGAEVRHRPCGDRRPRTSRRNPTGVRSGRSACRRFPLSFPVALDRISPTPRGRLDLFRVLLGHFFTRTVFVDRVSRVISSASATFAFSRTVPAAASTTSTTFARSFAVSAFPEALAS